MTRPRFLLAALLLGLGAAPAGAQDPARTFAALRSVDLRLATIAYRLTTGNAALCRDLAPTPGWALHSLYQYDPALRDTARAVFGFAAPLAVEAVVPGSPAAASGIAANDAVLAVNGATLDAAPGTTANSDFRDAALDVIGRQPADRPLRVATVHDGRRATVTLPPSPGCRSVFEVLLGPKMTASADGRIVQIGVRFFERYGDEEVAVVIAHELSHNILRHRARLEAAGVKWGLLAEIGRNGRLFRRTEEDADRLGVTLLANAGYDPASAPAFWRAHGGDIDGGFFRSRTHPSSAARAAALEAEVAAIRASGRRPYVPAVLATRDQPLQ